MLRALAIALSLLAPASAGAATLGTFTNDYDGFTDFDGPDAGTFDFVFGTPFTGDPVFTGVPVASDSFDLSSLAGQIIEELVITVTYGGDISFPVGNDWYLDVFGSDPASLADDTTIGMPVAPVGALSTVTLTIASTTDAFATALANMRVDFGFREETDGIDLLRIYDAVLTVNGTATVPLPAPVLLLLLALGGLGAARRRQGTQTA